MSFSSQTRGQLFELMDGQSYTELEFQETLRELEIINHLTMGYHPTLQAIERVAKANPGLSFKILDVGCGYGDTLRAVHKWASKQGIQVELTGVDLNPLATKAAVAATPEDYRIKFVTSNVFDLNGGEYDVIINALFMHHLSDEQIVVLMRWMTENSRLAWFINDLHRHSIAFHFIRLATKVLSSNRLIIHDAPASVARSFRSKDWIRYIDEAGLPRDACDLKWHWAFRYGLFCDANLVRQKRGSH